MIKEEVKKTVKYKNFFVEIDNYNYTLYKTKTVKDKNKKNKEITVHLGYYSDVVGTIEKMIEDSVNSTKKTVELKEYLAEHRRIKDELAKAIKT